MHLFLTQLLIIAVIALLSLFYAFHYNTENAFFSVNASGFLDILRRLEFLGKVQCQAHTRNKERR